MIKNDVAVIGIGLGGTKVGYESRKGTTRRIW